MAEDWPFSRLSYDSLDVNDLKKHVLDMIDEVEEANFRTDGIINEDVGRKKV